LSTVEEFILLYLISDSFMTPPSINERYRVAWRQADGTKQEVGGEFKSTRERKREIEESLFDLNLTRTLIGILNKDA
jgi:hypothetical protein